MQIEELRISTKVFGLKMEKKREERKIEEPDPRLIGLKDSRKT